VAKSAAQISTQLPGTQLSGATQLIGDMSGIRAICPDTSKSLPRWQLFTPKHRKPDTGVQRV